MDRLNRVVEALHRAGREQEWFEAADILWLAGHLPQGQQWHGGTGISAQLLPTSSRTATSEQSPAPELPEQLDDEYSIEISEAGTGQNQDKTKAQQLVRIT